jgi:hypothetical protein
MLNKYMHCDFAYMQDVDTYIIYESGRALFA